MIKDTLSLLLCSTIIPPRDKTACCWPKLVIQAVKSGCQMLRPLHLTAEPGNPVEAGRSPQIRGNQRCFSSPNLSVHTGGCLHACAQTHTHTPASSRAAVGSELGLSHKHTDHSRKDSKCLRTLSHRGSWQSTAVSPSRVVRF